MSKPDLRQHDSSTNPTRGIISAHHMRRPLFCLSAAAILAGTPHVAYAGACCGTGHGLGQRLGFGEIAAISLSTRFASRFGSYDVRGQFFPIPSGAFDGDARADLSAVFAPVARVQLGFVLPFVINLRHLGNSQDVGGGLSDVSFSGRFDLIPLSTTNDWPAIALTAALMVPTGRAAMDAIHVLAADATGLGAAEFRPGFFLEHSFHGRASAIVAASVGIRAETQEPRIALAPRLRLVAAMGPVFDMGLSLSIGVIHEREEAPVINGIEMPDADRHRTAALAFVGYDIASRFTLLGALEVDVPVRHLGQNEPATLALSIGLRRSFSWER